MTHCGVKEVRKIALLSLRPPFSPITLAFIGKRLRDKQPEIRKITF